MFQEKFLCLKWEIEMTTNKLSVTVKREMQYSSVMMSMAVGVTGIVLQEVLRGRIQRSSSTIITDSDCGSGQRAAKV